MVDLADKSRFLRCLHFGHEIKLNTCLSRYAVIFLHFILNENCGNILKFNIQVHYLWMELHSKLPKYRTGSMKHTKTHQEARQPKSSSLAICHLCWPLFLGSHRKSQKGTFFQVCRGTCFVPSRFLLKKIHNICCNLFVNIRNTPCNL